MQTWQKVISFKRKEYNFLWTCDKQRQSTQDIRENRCSEGTLTHRCFPDKTFLRLSEFLPDLATLLRPLHQKILFVHVLFKGNYISNYIFFYFTFFYIVSDMILSYLIHLYYLRNLYKNSCRFPMQKTSKYFHHNIQMLSYSC